MNLRKKTLISIVLLSLCCFLGALVYSIFIPVISEESGVIYELKAGTAKKTFIANLTNLGLMPHPILFSLFAYTQLHQQLKTGEYLFPRGANLYEIWKQVTNGTGLMNHPFTLVPGWSFYQLRQELQKTPGLRHTTALLTDKQIMQRLGHAEVAPEGEFLPDTYYYTKGITDLILLKRAYDHMQIKLSSAWAERANGLPYQSAYQALIAASLIEKEAYLASERAIISGVLINRLKQNMLLQFDPTVIYGMGQRYTGKIYKENLLEDNPYNTYVHKGLPPTPIAMPSMASIYAAMHPQKNNYYYFVARGDGSHRFSKTLEEHNQAVKDAKSLHGKVNDALIQQHIQLYLSRR